MVLTKCVTPEGSIRSDSFQLQLNFEFVQDMHDSRKVSKKLSLSSAMRSASSSLLNPKERWVLIFRKQRIITAHFVYVFTMYVHMYVCDLCTLLYNTSTHMCILCLLIIVLFVSIVCKRYSVKYLLVVCMSPLYVYYPESFSC